MKFLFDLFPVILFFVAFKLADIYVATGVAIAATFAQVGWLKLRGRKVDTMLWASLAIIVVFGGATLLAARRDLHQVEADGAVLALRRRARGRRALPAPQPDPHAARGADSDCPTTPGASSTGAGSRSSRFMGAANLYVAFNFSTDTWVNFKLFGGMGLMLLFVLAQGMFLAKYVEEKS